MPKTLAGGAVALLLAVLVGCGDTPDASKLPLPDGAEIRADQVRQGVAPGHYRQLLIGAPPGRSWRWLMHREGDALRDAGWHVEHNRHDGHPRNGWSADGPDDTFSYIERDPCFPHLEQRLQRRGVSTICASLAHPSDDAN
jgi:hypothetical protein